MRVGTRRRWRCSVWALSRVPIPRSTAMPAHRVTEVAEHAGVDGLTALDVYTAVVNPNWAPFGGCPYYEGAA